MNSNNTGTDTFPFPAHGFTCFHCGETFKTIRSARDHFGNDVNDEAGCVMKLTAQDKSLVCLVRSLKAELDLYREEDQPIMRKLYQLGAEHYQALMRAEEQGYARGLRDGREGLEQ